MIVPRRLWLIIAGAVAIFASGGMVVAGGVWATEASKQELSPDVRRIPLPVDESLRLGAGEHRAMIWFSSDETCRTADCVADRLHLTRADGGEVAIRASGGQGLGLEHRSERLEGETYYEFASFVVDEPGPYRVRLAALGTMILLRPEDRPPGLTWRWWASCIVVFVAGTIALIVGAGRTRAA